MSSLLITYGYERPRYDQVWCTHWYSPSQFRDWLWTQEKRGSKQSPKSQVDKEQPVAGGSQEQPEGEETTPGISEAEALAAVASICNPSEPDSSSNGSSHSTNSADTHSSLGKENGPPTTPDYTSEDVHWVPPAKKVKDVVIPFENI